MENLARNKQCDEVIRLELTRAGIPIVSKKYEGEVPYSLAGELDTIYGKITFTRAWRYWVVKCLLPMDVAQKIYNHPEGKYSVRAGGHGGAVSPLEQCVFLDDQGRTLIKKTELDLLVPGSKFHKEISEDKQYSFVDDPKTEGTPFVHTYHIDDQAGLLLFGLLVKN